MRYLLLGLAAILTMYIGYFTFELQDLSLILYPIKTTRESLQSIFVFGDEDLSYWNLGLAQKRLAEAEILRTKQKEKLAIRQANIALSYQTLGLQYMQKMKDKVDINYLQQKAQMNQDLLNSYIIK